MCSFIHSFVSPAPVPLLPGSVWELGSRGKRPPQPSGNSEAGVWESGAGPRLWVRVSLCPRAGPWALGLGGTLSGREGAGRIGPWLECGERGDWGPFGNS